MTNAVAIRGPDQHSESLAYAQRFIAAMRDEPIGFPFTDASFEAFDTSSSRAAARDLVREHLKAVLPKLDIDEMEQVVAWARAGGDVAHEALCAVLRQYTSLGVQPPVPLAAYQLDVLAGRVPTKRGGPQKASLFFRNLVLAVLVWRLTEEFGLSDRAACMLVVQAWKLEMKGRGVALIDYKSVQGIWSQIGPRIMP